MENYSTYIKALSKGDQNAFKVLFLRFHPKLVNFLTGFIKDEEVANDMAQDIFIKIWRNHSCLSNVKSFSSYLFMMAHNAICDYFDHSLVSKKYTIEMLLRPLETENPEEKLFADELQSLIEIKIEQMPPRRGEIFKMSRIQGLSNEAIADKLNISKRTVENQITLALRELRQMLALFIALFV